MSDITNVLIIGTIIGGLFLFRNNISSFLKNSGIVGANQTVGGAFGTAIGQTAAEIPLGVSTGIANAINPTNPSTMEENNAIRSAFYLPADTSQVQYYPFTPIPIQAEAQDNAIRSFFGLNPETSTTQYYPFTNIPITQDTTMLNSTRTS